MHVIVAWLRLMLTGNEAIGKLATHQRRRLGVLFLCLAFPYFTLSSG